MIERRPSSPLPSIARSVLGPSVLASCGVALGRAALCGVALCGVALGCGPLEPGEVATARSGRALVGVPVDGYPSYQERLALVAINRTRAAPNDVAHDSASSCSAERPATKPLMLSLEGSRAARFHSKNLSLNGGGLSHDSYCTLREDIASSGCDGAAACACVEGSECWSCTTLGGCGTSPWERAGRFGFGANGEVGAAGTWDGMDAVRLWVTECPPADGHRQILTGDDKDVIGLGAATGGSCWGAFFYGDTGYQGIETAVLPAGVHRPEQGAGMIEFRVNYWSAGAAQDVSVVVDGVCHAMAIELGAPTNAHYVANVDVPGGCHAYWFLAHDEAGRAHAYPEAGAWGVGDCTDWQPTRQETGCDGVAPPVVDAGIVVLPPDAGSSGAPDAGASGGVDAAASGEVDAGRASGGADAGAGGGGDAAVTAGGGSFVTDGLVRAGCGCQAASGGLGMDGAPLALLVLVVLPFVRRGRGQGR